MDALIFDLDGTLWDTCTTCAISWNEVVKRNKIPFRTITADDIKKVTGLPYEQCVRNVFSNVSETEIQLLLSEAQTEENLLLEKTGGMLYPGVLSGIKALSTKFPLFIVSNCQAGYIEGFLRQTDLGSYFKDFECWGNTRESKGSNVRSVMERNRLQRPVYIGDTQGDQIAALACNIPFWFVSYGFGTCSSYAKKFSNFDEVKNTALETE